MLHAIDNETGEIFRIDRLAKTKTRIATAPTNLDNLAFGPDGRLFVTNMPDNAIYEVDRETGKIRTVVDSPLTLPGGIARVGDTLYVADTFALSAVDLATGEVRDLGRDGESSGAPSIVAANATHLATASLHRGSVTVFEVGSQRVVARFMELGQPLAIALVSSHGKSGGKGADIRVVVATAAGELLELDSAKPARGACSRATSRCRWGSRVRSRAGSSVKRGPGGSSSSATTARAGSSRAKLAHPEGLTLLADGRIAVAEPAAQRVTLVDPVSGRKETIATGLPLGLLDLPTMPNGIFPTGLAVADDGALLLSSDVDGGILRLRPPR